MDDIPFPSFGVPDTRIVPGQCVRTVGVYVFQCPCCRKLFRADDRYEPVCTGPSEMRDDHAPEVMRLLRVEARRIFV